MYSLNEIIMDYGCKFTQYLLRMKWYTHSQVSVWMHNDQQKKRRSTKESMERPTSMKTEWAYILLLLVILPKVHDLSTFVNLSQYCFSWPHHVALNEMCDMIMNDEMEELFVWRHKTILAAVYCIR